MFFRKDRPKTEGSRHAHHLINFSPVSQQTPHIPTKPLDYDKIYLNANFLMIS